jgi:phosphoribosylformylglycinamidine synthase PurS subunit
MQTPSNGAGEELTGELPIFGEQGKQSLNLPRLESVAIGTATPQIIQATPMKARVFITLKNGVLDPQGKAIHHGLEGLGFSGINDVRAGKLIELDLADGTSDGEIEDMCRKLLANTVIENFRIERLETA